MKEKLSVSLLCIAKMTEAQIYETLLEILLIRVTNREIFEV